MNTNFTVTLDYEEAEQVRILLRAWGKIVYSSEHPKGLLYGSYLNHKLEYDLSNDRVRLTGIDYPAKWYPYSKMEYTNSMKAIFISLIEYEYNQTQIEAKE